MRIRSFHRSAARAASALAFAVLVPASVGAVAATSAPTPGDCRGAVEAKIRAAHNDAEGIVFDDAAAAADQPGTSGSGHYATIPGERYFSYQCASDRYGGIEVTLTESDRK